mmetsp:Transcript_8965/g.14598  ORF Transcript_8965/g.14598 Transcript_8965/m.14598 type:complete len:317 (+) Transcript_8965:128-1078(+)
MDEFDFGELEDLDKALHEFEPALTFPQQSTGGPLSIGYQSDQSDGIFNTNVTAFDQFGHSKMPNKVSCPPPQLAAPNGGHFVQHSATPAVHHYIDHANVPEPQPVNKVAKPQAASYNRERKSFREKQRRLEVNEKFATLAKTLEMHPKRERTELLQTAIDIIVKLRSQTKQLRAQLYFAEAKSMVRGLSLQQQNVDTDELQKKRKHVDAETDCQADACRPLKTAKSDTKKQEREPIKLIPATARNIAAAKPKASAANKKQVQPFDFSSIPGFPAMPSDFDSLSTLPPVSIIAALMHGHQQALANNKADSITHSHCA